MFKIDEKILTILFIGITSGAVAAENSNFLIKHPIVSLLSSSFVGTVSLGPEWGEAGHSQTLTLAPEVEKTYTANRPSNTLSQYDLFLGLQRPLTTKLNAQIGLNLTTTSEATLAGDIWDDASSEFNNYTYQYLIKRKQVALKGKLVGNLGWLVLPWVSASVGIGFNRSHHFTNMPIIYEAIASPNFSNQSVTAFTYAVGLGAQRALTKHLQIGVGYEFADWGYSALGSANGSITSTSLSLAHFYTQTFALNLSYLA